MNTTRGISRRQWGLLSAGTLAGIGGVSALPATEQASIKASRDLRIQDIRITPIALPDPPLLAAGGCHGPYFLRNVIEVVTHNGVIGIGETHGGEDITRELQKCREPLLGQSVAAYRSFAALLGQVRTSVYSGIELACLDALGQMLDLRVCDLLGGPVREEVEFAAYLFYRYAADHPRVLDDPRLQDNRRRALDSWGEVRTPEAMAHMADQFRQRFGFRVFKLKAGVLPPEEELKTLEAMNAKFGGKHLLRIDPNGRWTVSTAVAMGQKLRDLPMEYYEDPVAGMSAMADVREQTGQKMSTNMCVTRFEHIPRALIEKPIDVVLGDHHGWGGLTAFPTLGVICDNAGWRLSQHSNSHAGITMAAMIHAGAITPQLTIASDTHYVWLPDEWDIIEGPKLPIRDGRMSIPKGPGLGVMLNRDKLARAHETYNKCGMRKRDDATTMRRFDPNWTRTLF